MPRQRKELREQQDPISTILEIQDRAMSSYDSLYVLSSSNHHAKYNLVEHNVPATNAASERRRQRPDLDSFYSSLNHIDTSQTRNANAVPIPADISASFRLLDEGMQALMESNPNQDLAEEIHVYLRDLIEAPPTKVKGLPAEFIDGRTTHPYIT